MLTQLEMAVVDTDDAEDFQLTRKQAQHRFGPPTTDSEIQQLIVQRIPVNTQKQTNWALAVWSGWSRHRGLTEPIQSLQPAVLNDQLCRFLVEVNRQDGTPYPASTLYQIVSALQRHLRETGRPELNILDQHNLDFTRARQVLDARMKQLTATGIGSVKKQAQPLSCDQENQLWECGIFSIETADAMLNAVFWYNCKCFGLRGGDEHRELVVEQYSIDSDAKGRFLRFVGRSAKNFQGGLQHKKVTNKDLKIYARPEIGNRCVVDLFSEYLSHIPRSGLFYCRPIKNARPPRFSKQVDGKNTLSTIVRDFCKRAGFKGNYTNHSGKVTCATELFQSGMDEQLIMRQTGHRSNAVHLYKRPSAAQDCAVSDILQAPKKPKLKLSQKENIQPEACSSTSSSVMKVSRERGHAPLLFPSVMDTAREGTGSSAPLLSLSVMDTAKEGTCTPLLSPSVMDAAREGSYAPLLSPVMDTAREGSHPPLPSPLAVGTSREGSCPPVVDTTLEKSRPGLLSPALMDIPTGGSAQRSFPPVTYASSSREVCPIALPSITASQPPSYPPVAPSAISGSGVNISFCFYQK